MVLIITPRHPQSCTHARTHALVRLHRESTGSTGLHRLLCSCGCFSAAVAEVRRQLADSIHSAEEPRSALCVPEETCVRVHCDGSTATAVAPVLTSTRSFQQQHQRGGANAHAQWERSQWLAGCPGRRAAARRLELAASHRPWARTWLGLGKSVLPWESLDGMVTPADLADSAVRAAHASVRSWESLDGMVTPADLADSAVRAAHASVRSQPLCSGIKRHTPTPRLAGPSLPQQ
eukprot:COSAG01_NODE_767_length_13740_cov_525.281651_11_plen_234_part_00